MLIYKRGEGYCNTICYNGYYKFQYALLYILTYTPVHPIPYTVCTDRPPLTLCYTRTTHIVYCPHISRVVVLFVITLRKLTRLPSTIYLYS